jgi:hypothetical protein
MEEQIYAYFKEEHVDPVIQDTRTSLGMWLDGLPFAMM